MGPLVKMGFTVIYWYLLIQYVFVSFRIGQPYNSDLIYRCMTSRYQLNYECWAARSACNASVWTVCSGFLPAGLHSLSEKYWKSKKPNNPMYCKELENEYAKRWKSELSLLQSEIVLSISSGNVIEKTSTPRIASPRVLVGPANPAQLRPRSSRSSRSARWSATGYGWIFWMRHLYLEFWPTYIFYILVYKRPHTQTHTHIYIYIYVYTHVFTYILYIYTYR